MTDFGRRSLIAGFLSLPLSAERARGEISYAHTASIDLKWQPSKDFVFQKTVRSGGSGVPLQEFPTDHIRKLILSRNNSTFLEIVDTFEKYLAYPVDPAGALLQLPNYALELLETIDLPPEEGSDQLAGELLELYWAAALRDIPFSQMRDAPECKRAFDELKRVGLYAETDYKPLRLFEAPWSEGRDSYLSTFLIADVPRWPEQLKQRYPSFREGQDFCTTENEIVRALSGEIPALKHRELKGPPDYVVTGRRLAALVYQDHPAQIFENAALQLYQFRHRMMRARGVWGYQERYTPFVFGGLPDLLNKLSTICKLGLDLSWLAKWGLFFYPRPEEVALTVMSASPTARLWNVKQVLSASSLYERRSLGPLPLAYPEGAPVHPSYPAAHAVIAGAAVTVLKAFVRQNSLLPNQFLSDEARLASGENFSDSVDGELNKLAWNMSFGRCFAGVHFRSDCVGGLRLGEALAIRYLTEEKRKFPINVRMQVRRFDGNSVSI